jgi:hypothetical protein
MDTSVSRNLREPLLLEFLILSFPSPSVNPLLLLLVPNGLLPLPVGNTLLLRELLPLRQGFWFGQRFGTRQLRRWWR